MSRTRRCRSFDSRLVVLLQYHGQLEMQEAIRNAFLHNFQTMMGAHVDTVNPLLVLHINRNTIVEDTIKQVSSEDMRVNATEPAVALAS